MPLHELRPARGATKRRKIVGRGPGSAHGKTSGRGHRGQKARSGRGILRTLEGGQIPLIRRLPKVGFRSKRPTIYQIVKLEGLNRFQAGTVIDARTLKDKGFIKNPLKPYKILGNGEIKKALTIEAYSFSGSARDKIAKAGGEAKTVKKDELKKVFKKQE